MKDREKRTQKRRMTRVINGKSANPREKGERRDPKSSNKVFYHEPEAEREKGGIQNTQCSSRGLQ